MQNHLSYRWPTGPSPSSSPLLSSDLPRRRHWGRALLIALGCLAGLALLVLAAFWGMLTLAEYLAPQQADPPTIPSNSISRPQAEEWSPEDLPWGEPDPNVEISLSEPSGQLLTAQEIYQQVLPSVVCVQADHGGSYNVGSGVILTSDGYIVTNYHVIEECSALEVMLLTTQRVHDAVLIGYDEELDLAVLKVEAEDLTPARLADSDRLQVGDQVYAIGNPMGYLYGTMTDGIISALHVEVDVDGKSMNLIQTSAALNSGNSGGALINDRGQVVGITVAKISGKEDDALVEGLGLAIPISDARPFINYILENGETCKPAIGITCSAAVMDGTAGVVIQSVEPDGPAMEAGLQKLDLIVAADGKTVDSIYSLKRAINEAGVGGTLSLTVLREGEQLELTCGVVDSTWQ